MLKKWSPKRIQNVEKYEKRHATLMPQIDAVVKKNNVTGRPKVRYLGRLGGRGADFVQYLLTSSLILYALHTLGGDAADFLVPFSDMGPPMVDLFCFFDHFGAMPTNMKKYPKGRRKDGGTARRIGGGHGLGGPGPVSGHAREKV